MKTNNLFLVLMAAAACAAINGCTAFGPAPRGTDPMCTGTMDDGVSCTVAVCDGDAWRQVREDGLCDADEICDLDDGCVPRGGTPDCDDDIACTADSYNGTACVNARLDARCPDGDTCRASAADGASGCYTPPTMEECDSAADCNDGVSCTANRCNSDGECVYVPDESLCDADQTCTASGCVDDTDPPPTGDRFCATGGLVGERVRISFTGMHGIRTFAGRTLTASTAGVALWTYYGTQYTYAPGTMPELAVDGGTLNVHPYEGGALTFDSHMADLQSISSATNDVTCEERGIVVEVLRAGSWVRLPEGFCYFGMDTDVSRRWGESPDPLIPTGSRVGRALVTLECEHQGEVYDNGHYRDAR